MYNPENSLWAGDSLGLEWVSPLDFLSMPFMLEKYNCDICGVFSLFLQEGLLDLTSEHNMLMACQW